MWKYLKKISNTNNPSERRSKWFSDKVTKPPTSSDNSFAPTLIYVGNKKKSNSWWKFFKAR